MTKARDLANIISGGFTVDDIPDIPASKITSGSIADARLPATALNSNVDLTNLSASNLTSGTIPTARITALPTGLGGKVLQTVQGTTNTQVSTTGITFTDTGLSATITPSSTSSKILIIVSQHCYVNNNNLTYAFGGLRILRGSSSVWNPNPENGNGSLGFGGQLTSGNNISNFYQIVTLNYLDTPSTTSATTYKTQQRAYASATGTIITQINDSNQNGSSSITLMEIQG